MRRFLLTAVMATGFAASLPAAAQFQKPEDAVAYRRSVFTVMGTHFGRIGAMVNGKLPYDAAAVTANAEIVEMMSKLPYAAFPAGTEGTKKGEPKPNVWTERAKFDEAAKKMQGEVVKLVAAARAGNAGDVKTAFGAAGSACKACHDDFRNK
ncbi:MAG: cytochrome c [Acidobacteriota bacterium]|nr:cytochrome c [Acidobacteriota bacterium]